MRVLGRIKRCSAVLFLMVVCGMAFADNHAVNSKYGRSADLPLPSSLPLVDYERQLYLWTGLFKYKSLGWSQDKGVRDTGPYINNINYGTHEAVRIFYSPEMMEWLTNGRQGDIADGAVIVKEMYTSPAAIYTELANDPAYAQAADYEEMLAKVISGWVVMVKDSKLSHDGWFWGSVEIPGDNKSSGMSRKEWFENAIENTMLDTAKNRGVNQLRWSGAAMPCIRCHASAEKELTFSDLANVKGHDDENALIFRVDDSWRNPLHFRSYPLCNIKNNQYVRRFMYGGADREPSSGTCPPPPKKEKSSEVNLNDHSLHNNVDYLQTSEVVGNANSLFQSTFDSIPAQKLTKANKKRWTFPPEWMDHVAMPAGHLTEYITSDNCIGCHGGLAGSPNRNVMFVPPPASSNGSGEGSQGAPQGYNVSEYGEWRWSPMGLAGRDPIFHAQLESEMSLLERDSRIDKKHPNNPPLIKGRLSEKIEVRLEATKDAVTNKCLTCHGAMGERQLHLDATESDSSGLKSSLKPNFKVDYFYLPEMLTKADVKQAKKDGTADYAKYGALAREGISCMICHRIDAADPSKVKKWSPGNDWVTSKADKTLAYNLFHHSSGEFNKGPLNQVFGQFDVAQKPMEHSFGLSPLKNDFISDSQMCGSCHTINLPNIGSTDTSRPVLKAAADPNFPAFKDYPHSIEQATFVEWQNSEFSAGDTFQSCQDCHMPSNFEPFADTNLARSDPELAEAPPLITQIASIQDSSYPSAGNSLPTDEIDIPVRDDYKRHTHVGLNVFLLKMMDQFSDLLGLDKSDYMTGVSNGSQLALDSMIQQAQISTARISVDVTGPVKSVFKNGQPGKQVTAKIKVSNLTGHRYPSGVAFRRAFLDVNVTDRNGKVVWQSGGTNEVGVILNGDTRQPLDTEFLPNDPKLTLPNARPSQSQCLALLKQDQIHYQPHHQIITEQDQVQIYEELNLNAQCGFTTSFVHRVHPIKDNRLLPKGWKESWFFEDQGKVIHEFMEATDPEGVTTAQGVDPDYRNHPSNYPPGINTWQLFPGEDNIEYQMFIPNCEVCDTSGHQDQFTVNATLYNQSIPPYWLKHRFEEAPHGRATRRLHYMASRLQLGDGPTKDWKLKLVSDTQTVTD